MAKTDDKTTIYRFHGNGLGVPGLPHELTRAEAEALQVLDQLDAAIAAGVYQPIKEA